MPTSIAIHRPSSLAPLVEAARSAPPRDFRRMAAEATEIGTRMGRDAFYSWEQGRELIEGATIGLAYALLPVWRYVQARVEIVDRVGDVVTLRGVALDLASIVSVERDYTFTIAPPPGKYANKADQRQRWEAMQTQSASSKAVRGAILGMLPPWLVGAAINAAKAAASASILNGKTFDEAAGVAVKAFADGGGVKLHELEAWIGSPLAMWTIDHLEKLRALYGQMKRGEVSPAAWRATLTKPEPAAVTMPWAEPATTVEPEPAKPEPVAAAVLDAEPQPKRRKAAPADDDGMPS